MKKAIVKRGIPLLLTVLLVLSGMPMGVYAQEDGFAGGELPVLAVGSAPLGGEIVAFAPLADSTARQTVPLGTALEDLDLPGALTAPVEAVPEQADNVQDSGAQAQEDIADTDTQDGGTTGADSVSGNYAADSTGDEEIPSADEAQSGTQSEVQQTDGEDLLRMQAITGSALALGNRDAAEDTGSTQQTVSAPVSEWLSEPKFDPEVLGTYTFTPVLDGAWGLAQGVELPTVTVQVVMGIIPLTSDLSSYTFDVSEGNIKIEPGTNPNTLKVSYGAGLEEDNIPIVQQITLTGTVDGHSEGNPIKINASSSVKFENLNIESSGTSVGIFTNNTQVDVSIALSGTNTLLSTGGHSQHGLGLSGGHNVTICGDGSLSSTGCYGIDIGGGTQLVITENTVVTAKGLSAVWAAGYGIGTGNMASDTCSLTISGNAQVRAEGTHQGIGGYQVFPVTIQDSALVWATGNAKFLDESGVQLYILQITVTDNNNEPVTDAQVQSESRSTTTDSSGEAYLFIPEGETVHLEISKEGYASFQDTPFIKSSSLETKDIQLHLAPAVDSISAPGAVLVGEALSLSAPTVSDYGAAITEQGWEISEDGTTGWTAFSAATAMTYAHNGQFLRYYATNSVGTGYSNSVQITVNKYTLTLVLTAGNITYGEAAAPILTGNSGSGAVTWEYKAQGTPDSGYSASVPVNAGSYTVRATVAETDTYNGGAATADFLILQAVPAMTLAANPAGGSLASDDVILTAELTGVSATDFPTESVTFKNGDTVLGTVYLVNGTAEYIWEAVPFGTHDLTAEYAGDTNYEEVSDSISGYEVEKKTQDALAITGVPETVTYGDDSFDLGTTGGSGDGGVTYTVQSGDAVSLVGNTVTVEKAGTAVLQAVKAADEVYNETAAVVTVTVKKAVPTVQENPAAGGANVGAKLSAVSLTGISVLGVDGSPLVGSFAWETPETVIQGEGIHRAVFTPDSANYEAVSFEVQVRLATEKPVITEIKATPKGTDSTALEVTATGSTSLTYQWQVWGSWTDIPGATTAAYTYTGLAANTAYTVRVIVTDANGNSTTSQHITFQTGAAAITGLPGSYTLAKGSSVSWTPQPEGGTWKYDADYLTLSEKDGTATFTAKKVGKTTVTYTAGGTEFVITLTVHDSDSPKTGDDNSLGWYLVFGFAALCGLGVLAGLWNRRRKKEN